MKLFPKHNKQKANHIPGELVHIGKRHAEETRLSFIDYDSETYQERILQKVDEAYQTKGSKKINWLNVDGLHDMLIMEKILSHFDIHPLVMEDLLNVHQRPKMEDLDAYLFIVLKMISFDNVTNDIHWEQVSFILSKNYLITFQEKPGDVFESVRERLRKSKGRIRKLSCDYLAYALIDAVIDNYYVVLESISEKIEAVENEVVANPSSQILNEIHQLKKHMMLLRKAVWPLREVVNNLIRTESPIIKKETIPFIKDLYDHTIQVTDSIDTFKEMLTGLMDLYLSNISNRMNEVMKVLTIFAAIFIPLTFVAGIYGMNFDFMPELKWKYSYFVLWGIWFLIGGGMLGYFKKKKWL
ncbi:MAG: magnesium/cobalt transporter CorA [bacterium]|nr:magnesium/cobalt transporter CorA [bacterium]MBU1917556.1 magnesium/cobalt transporter CorA [bacterium]